MSIEYPLMAFIANKGVAPKGERYDRSSLVTDIENKLYKRTEFGDFIYSSNNLETGSIGLNEYGKACISPVYSIFQPTKISDSSFLGRRLVRKDFINSMVKWRQGVIYGQWRIHESDFLKIEIFVPLIKEQRKIGEYLTQLDHLITLHQRKLNTLKKIKSALLEKMFPKNGSNVPEIRFTGFTEAWEQRKLDDITTRVSEMYNQPDLPRVEYEDINPGQGTLNKELSSKESTKNGIVFEPKDVLYGKLRPYLMNWLFPQFKGVAVGDFWVLRPTACDASFLFRFIQSERFWYYSNISSGSKMPRADWAFVSKGNYLVPKNREEQRQIGTLFSHLDSLITLHQRKLDTLKKIKSALLEKMFV